MSKNLINSVKYSIIEPYRNEYSKKAIINENDMGIIKSCYDFYKNPCFFLRKQKFSYEIFEETKNQIIQELNENENENNLPIEKVISSFIKKRNEIRLTDFLISSREISLYHKDSFMNSYINQHTGIKHQFNWFCDFIPQIDENILRR